MGSFTDKFRLNQRLRNSDFGRSETVQHWKLWAEDILKRAGYVDKDESLGQVQIEGIVPAHDIEVLDENGTVVDIISSKDALDKLIE